MSKIVLVLQIILLVGCGPLRVNYKTLSTYNKNELICCTNSCSDIFDVECVAMHYQSGYNYIWINLIPKDTIKNIKVLGIHSNHFSYLRIKNKIEKKDVNCVFENSIKISYKSFIDILKTEEVNLEVEINNTRCNNIRLFPKLE